MARETISCQSLDDLMVEYGLNENDVIENAMRANINVESKQVMQKLMERMYAGDEIIEASSKMSGFEKYAVSSAINNVFHARFSGEHIASLEYAVYMYLFKIREFDDHEFVGKLPLDE